MSSHMNGTTTLAATGRDKSVTSVFYIILLTFFLMSCLSQPVAAVGKGGSVRQVLVLHSYNVNTQWTKSVMDGIESAFERYEGTIKLDVEYMDTRRITDRKHYENLLALYRHKAVQKQYEIIITVNNNAVNFLLENRDLLYPAVPIVFCGVAISNVPEIQGRALVTGAMQKRMLLPTIEIALKLHPSARQVVLVCYTRRAIKLSFVTKSIDNAKEKFGSRTKFIERWLAEPSVEELIKAIDGLDKETIVIFMDLYKDKAGNRDIFKDAYDEIQQRCKAPIYGLTKQWFGYAPIVGGKMNSGFHQGKAAGEMALRILNGQNPRDIPVVRDGLDKYFFDYVFLKRFGISLSKLPKASIVINQPESFYYLYKGRIWTVTVVILALTVMVIILSANILRRKRAEVKLLHYQKQLKSLASELSLTEERERRRIATELHDRIGQTLVISKIKLQTLLKRQSFGQSCRELNEVCDSLDRTIQDTRSLTFDLSSPILYELGLEAAVAEWLTEQIKCKHGIEAEFESDGQPKPLEDDIRVMLFRDVRELLINVVRHSRAHRVKVVSRKVNSRIYVSVEDDGIGFNPHKVASATAEDGGFGLFSIRERLEQIGGRLEIESEPGRGTTVTIIAPLRQEKTDSDDEKNI